MILNPDLLKNWTELFGLLDNDTIIIKRIISIISGAILPIVSLLFLHLLVTYVQKNIVVIPASKILLNQNILIPDIKQEIDESIDKQIKEGVVFPWEKTNSDEDSNPVDSPIIEPIVEEPVKKREGITIGTTRGDHAKYNG